MSSIKKSFETINKNLLYYANVDMPSRNLGKEREERIKEKYLESFKDCLTRVENEIDKVHETFDFNNKVKNLNDLIDATDLTSDKEPWRFFYDSQKTLDALMIDKKRDYFKSLMQIDSEYTKICEKLESELESKYKKFSAVNEKLDNLDFEFDKALREASTLD